MLQERLQKILSRAGVASRRAAEEIILAGRVTVDGRIVAELGRKFDPARAKICVDGKKIAGREEKVYFLLNKPKGYVSTVKDERGRRTVLDLLPEVAERIYPVGRLDRNTEGLLLLTNDGELMNALLHPKFAIEKTYRAKVRGDVTEDKLDRLRAGIKLEDGPAAPAQVRILSREDADFKIEIILREGRNREVRRMFEAIGCEVTALKRVEFAGLTLEGVKRGEHRPLTAKEVTYLYNLTGASKKNI